MAPDPNLVDQAARWVESFLRSNACSEADVNRAKNSIFQENIDGAVLLSMSAREIQDVLHLKFGDAKKLEQELKLRDSLAPGEVWELVPGDPVEDLAEAQVPRQDAPPHLTPQKWYWRLPKLTWKKKTLCVAVLILFPTSAISAAVWFENLFQEDLCAQIRSCRPGDVKEIIRVSQGFESFLPNKAGLNWLRTKVWLGEGASCFASLPEHVNKCLENAKGATQSCEGDACLFSLKDDILRLDASIGGHLLSHNVSVIEELKDEVFSALVRRSQTLNQDLTRLSSEDRPNLVDFFDKWTQLKEFLSKGQHGLSEGQHGRMNAQFEKVLERMKAVHHEAEAKMNLTASIDRMLGLAKSLEDGETSNSDLQHVSLMLSQAVENKDHAALSMEYQKWIHSLCSGLQDFVGKLDSFGPAVTFMFVAITDHLEAYLQECKIKTALEAGKMKVEESLQTMKGLQEVRNALDKQRSLWKWLFGRKNALVRSVETYLTLGLDKVQPDSSVDLVMTFEQFEPLRMAATELAHHVQPLQERVSKVSEDLWKRSFDLMDRVSSGIQGACSSASMPSLLVMVSDLVRYVWHRSEKHGKTVELGQRFGHFGKQLRSKIEHSEAQILAHNSTIPVNVESLRRDLEEARGCVRAIVPWFLVLAEDADLCGKPCSVPFQQIQHAVKEGLGADPTSHPYLRKLSRVGLAGKQACDCSAIRAITVDQQTDHYAKSRLPLSRDFQERRERVVERRNASVQYLLSECSLPSADSACNSAQHIQFAFSDKVHDLFRGQLGKLRSALKQGLFDDVLAIISSIPAWEALRYSVQPELIIAKDHQSMKEAVLGHAKGLASQAVEQYEKRQYKSLQSSLAAISAIQAKLSAVDSSLDQLQTVWETLRKKILGYVKELRGEALRRLQEETGQPEGFANSIITLGILAFEIPIFKDSVLQEMNEVLNFAGGGSTGMEGMDYLLRLGQILMKQKDDTSADDGTMSRSAAAKRIASEFKQFQNVQNMFWNQAVQKMQKSPDECVDEMKAKAVANDQEAPLDRDDLKKGLSSFWHHYDTLLNRSLDGEIQIAEVVAECLQEVARLQKHHNDPGQLNPLLIKDSIPRLLAHVFTHYSIAATGEEYMSFVATSKKQSQGLGSLLGGIKTPHNIQVLAVLRFFGFGEQKSDLANQLVQIETGGGKSLILGAAATVFAMLGFEVRDACYSDYLSSRDAKEFHQTFADFRVAPHIKYSKITTFSEDMVAKKGDIRSLTLELFAGKPLKKQSVSNDLGRNQVLLVDEVDVFMGPDFVGKTHNQVARLQHPGARKVLESLWQKRGEAKTPQAAQELCFNVMSSQEYQSLLQEFKAFEIVVESQVKMMCSDLHEYVQKKHPMPEVDPNQGCIGYKIHDRVDCDAVFGYKTAFAYLEEKKLKVEEARLKEALSLQVPCGQFSYTNLNPRHIFGVSGTVEQLQMFQRQEVEKHGLRVFTTVPSVYGQSKFRFLQQNDAIKVVPALDFHQEIALAIQEIIKQKRAIIVFFEDESSLKDFRRSDFCKKLPTPEVLLEKLTFDEKTHIIKKAGNTGQITLAVAPFGRGSDFVSYDDKLQENGGVHVLQTFPSSDSSEEVQFQGRTARQGKRGTYSLILHEEDMKQKFGLARDILHDGQGKGYEKMRRAREEKSAQKFAHLASDLQEAHKKDALSHSLLDKLLAGDREKATAAYLEFYKTWMNEHITSSKGRAAHHYVICLDESGSMWGVPFRAATQAVQEFAREAKAITQGTASAVSLVMFSHNSRVACNKTPLEKHSECTGSIIYGGGGTTFDRPLQDAMRLIEEGKDKYDKQFIMFYTDGFAGYPNKEVEDMKGFMAKFPGKLEFFAISESEAHALTEICKQLYPSSPLSQHCLSQVKPQQISTAMQQTLRRMNMAYVQA